MCPSPVITFMTEMTKMKYPTLTRDKIKNKKGTLVIPQKDKSGDSVVAVARQSSLSCHLGRPSGL